MRKRTTAQRNDEPTELLPEVAVGKSCHGNRGDEPGAAAAFVYVDDTAREVIVSSRPAVQLRARRIGGEMIELAVWMQAADGEHFIRDELRGLVLSAETWRAAIGAVEAMIEGAQGTDSEPQAAVYGA